MWPFVSCGGIIIGYRRIAESSREREEEKHSEDASKLINKSLWEAQQNGGKTLEMRAPPSDLRCKTSPHFKTGKNSSTLYQFDWISIFRLFFFSLSSLCSFTLLHTQAMQQQRNRQQQKKILMMWFFVFMIFCCASIVGCIRTSFMHSAAATHCTEAFSGLRHNKAQH